MPERTVLDILCNVEHWLNWTRHFGPLSGTEPKIANATERYILTTFAYGCNLGPTQTARHVRGHTTYRQLSYANRRHVSADTLQRAICDILNAYHKLDLPKCWGTGKRPLLMAVSLRSTRTTCSRNTTFAIRAMAALPTLTSLTST